MQAVLKMRMNRKDMVQNEVNSRFKFKRVFIEICVFFETELYSFDGIACVNFTRVNNQLVFWGFSTTKLFCINGNLAFKHVPRLIHCNCVEYFQVGDD